MLEILLSLLLHARSRRTLLVTLAVIVWTLASLAWALVWLVRRLL